MTVVESIERGEWERAALLLLLGASRVLARLPSGRVDDLLAVLSQESDAGEPTHNVGGGT